MNFSLRITLTLFLAFFAFCAKAQFGHVVIHSDPRLAVLLKKNPTATPLPTPVEKASAAPKGATVNGNHPSENAEAPNEERHFVPVPSPRDGKIIYSGKGFRVQIYNGYDRDKAIKVRTEFMRTNSDTRAYLVYTSPFFRVRIGDYRTREQAASKLREVKGDYPTPCMIVPDQVTIHAN